MREKERGRESRNQKEPGRMKSNTVAELWSVNKELTEPNRDLLY